MIDTLRLRFDDFKITDQSQFTVLAGTFQPGLPESLCNYHLWSGTKGLKAFINTKKINVSIIPNKHNPGKTFAIVQLSIPRMLDELNVFPCRSNMLNLIYESVFSLSRFGFECDPADAKIMRVDFFCNLPIKQPLTHYFPLFFYNQISHLKKYQIDHNVGWRNKSRELLIYDKIQEIKDTQKKNIMTIFLSILVYPPI
jgi:hypothetical protein